MALSVQDDAGDVVDANAYLAVADFKSYHDDRGNDYSAYSDGQIGTALVRATDYLDGRFRFRGIKLLPTQTTMWPRQAGTTIFIPWEDVSFLGPDRQYDPPGEVIYLQDPSGNDIVGVPRAIKFATAEYALRALGATLYMDAPAPDGGRMIDTETVKVDVIEHTIKYVPAQGTGTFQMPAYPIADMMLMRAGLIETGRWVFR